MAFNESVLRANPKFSWAEDVEASHESGELSDEFTQSSDGSSRAFSQAESSWSNDTAPKVFTKVQLIEYSTELSPELQQSEDPQPTDLGPTTRGNVLNNPSIIYMGTSSNVSSVQCGTSSTEDKTNMGKLVTGMTDKFQEKVGTPLPSYLIVTKTKQEKKHFADLLERLKFPSPIVVSSNMGSLSRQSREPEHLAAGILHTPEFTRQDSPSHSTTIGRQQPRSGYQQAAPFHPRNRQELDQWHCMYPRTSLDHMPHLPFTVPPIKCPIPLATLGSAPNA
ncbi:uncharacterized protein PAC_03895 [Phialocephala subalpina]|uniref:Uncharacterized protein n=1 Tax=Phialocephala subalpina TaxID=576137 RepID=A0A1L7WML5_9HELO|nr:uncharacterized protein PAC_03895 [Phialocephala subalpina]